MGAKFAKPSAMRRRTRRPSFFTTATPLALIFVLLLVAGFFQSLQYTATQALGYADIGPTQMSTATSRKIPVITR